MRGLYEKVPKFKILVVYTYKKILFDFQNTAEYPENDPLTEGDDDEEEALSLPLEIGLDVNDTNENSNVQATKKLYACDQCGGRYTRLYNLKMHKKTIHEGIRSHSCQICGKGFVNSTKLKSHLTLHTGKPFTCEICAKSFTRSTDLEKHKQFVHERIRSFICPECGLRFSTASILRDHITTHTGQKRFPCDLCPRQFNRFSHISAHKLTVHKGVPGHLCKVCAKSFETTAELTKHITTAHRKTEYACDQCDRIFLFRGSLFNHKRTIHQGLRSYVCKICDRSFVSTSNLKYHLSSAHTGEKSQACEECGKTFIRACDLLRHKQHVH